MELYSSAPDASMSMRADVKLDALLKDVIKDDAIDVAIETGTFLGAGSTRFIAEAFKQVRTPKRFVTVEVNFSNWCQAKKNLAQYAFVDCRWGCAVGFYEAEQFMGSDDALRNHHAYPGVYIDDIVDPLSFYLKELRGQIPFTTTTVASDVRGYLWEGEELLRRLLVTHQDHNPLVVLDSAGGVGFLEFKIVMDVMAGRPFTLLLDDTHHLKHFRSLHCVRTMPEFEMIGEGRSWALAMHHAS